MLGDRLLPTVPPIKLSLCQLALTRTNLYIITIILILTISITIINVNCLSFNKFKDLAV